MTRRAHLRSLADIAAVRIAQQDGARLALGQADETLRSAGRDWTREDETQTARQAQWLAQLDGPRLDLDLAAAWAGSILVGQQALDMLARRRETAEAGRETALDTWRLAHGRQQSAEDILQSATRRARRAAEEATLAEAADRAARGGRSA